MNSNGKIENTNFVNNSGYLGSILNIVNSEINI